ncbi:porin family protein [Pontiella agarivorans]|uniref:Porin family protein n=1 Tax=Pontiella agarivorans TaxID=3038953 RepID=A0ABU5N186_9BACT|nr:porin family protein [Pontiella agarivorans]MDZ8120208.1 porin family protein [Pontiella agarivorans]
MKKTNNIILGAIMVMAITAQTSNAKTLLGTNHVRGAFGMVKFGDNFSDDVLGYGYGFEGAVNIAVHSNIDLNITGSYLTADGDTAGVNIDTTTLSGGASLLYHFSPRETVNPFISAGVGAVRSELEIAGSEEHETDTGLNAGAGIEIEASENILCRIRGDYINIDNEDDIAFTASAGYWFTARFMGEAGLSYSLDSEDIVANLGLVFSM